MVGTTSIEKSEEISSLLKLKKIKHNILNAKNHEAEASIIAEAGNAGAVTIATNMAGRGTDIQLGGNKNNPKYINNYLNGCIEVVNPDAETFLVSSGCCVSQAREAVRQMGEKGTKIGLIKIKSIRPFPKAELLEALKNAKKIFRIQWFIHVVI